MVQRNRWQLLFTMGRNKDLLSELRVHASAPANTWDVDDDVLEVESVNEEEEEEPNSDDELRRSPR